MNPIKSLDFKPLYITHDFECDIILNKK